jgi:hypothetical protein
MAFTPGGKKTGYETIDLESSAVPIAGSPCPPRRAAVIVLALGCIPLLGCQELGQAVQNEPQWMVSIHGVVIDTLTKKPVSGAAVYLDRDPPSPPGSLLKPPVQESGRETKTGWNGEFRFSDVDPTPHFLQIVKPGYTSSTNDLSDYSSYEIHPGSQMGELRLFLTPIGEVTGRITSDMGQFIPGLQLTLYRKLIEDRRGVWEKHGQELSDAHGVYNFTGLKAGTYVVVSSWLVDNDPGPPRGPGCRSYQLDPRSGYAPEANPGVLDFSAAEPIVLKQGQRAVVDLKLQHQVFHAVTLPPGRGFIGLRDRNGRELRRDPPPGSQCGWVFPASVNRATGLQTMYLPDGTYTMPMHAGGVVPQGPGQPTKVLLANYATFTVTGGPVAIAETPAQLLPAPATQIHAHYDLTTHPCHAPQNGSDPSPTRPTLWLSRADPLPEKALRIVEYRRTDHSNEFPFLYPGRYWVHAAELSEAGYAPNTYVSSITAGGVDMSQEPLVVGLDGSNPPLEVTLRNDCGTLQMKYAPPIPYHETVGVVEPFFGLLVPQFSGWANTQGFAFDENRPQNDVLENLPPGHYKFYLTRQMLEGNPRDPTIAPVDLGSGQDVWLEAGGKAEISVTEPPPE